MAIYHATGVWLHDHTPPEASVGALEVGIIGYYAERRMVDFAGLIQPETARRLTRTATYEDAARWAVDQFRPTYLVLQEHLFPQLEADTLFADHCRADQTFTNASYPARLIVYYCRWEGSPLKG